MKRAILVLMIVVFALVTVLPAFAMPQDAQGIIVEYGRIIAIRKAGGDQQDYQATIVLEEGRIIAIRKAGGDPSLTVRKAGGDQQEY